MMNRFLIAFTLFCAILVGGAVELAAQTASSDLQNATVQSILDRRSVRKYKPQAIPREVLDIVAKCAINAPSAVNAQPWQVRIVTNQDWLKQVGAEFKKTNQRAAEQADFVHPFFNSPAVIFIAAGKSATAQLDCGLLIQNICLAAQSLGLGTVIMGHPIGFMKSEAVAPQLAKLDFPEGFELTMSIAIGYPDEAPDARPRDAAKLRFIE